MTRYLLFSSRLTLSAFILSCLILLGAGVRASTQIWASESENAQEFELRAINKTDALKVVSIRKMNDGLPMAEVTLLNQSSKNIISYMLTIGDLMILTDYVPSGGFFAPGEEKVERTSLGNFEAAAAKIPDHAGELIISAVYFDDHTGEGDSARVEMIRRRYKGAKEQIKLVLPILRSALNSSEDAESVLLSLESQASRLPSETEKTKHLPDYREGRDLVKQELDEHIQNLRSKKSSPDCDLKAELKELIAFYEQFLMKL